jgi:hypothetical protein
VSKLKTPEWTQAAVVGADIHPTVVEWVRVADLIVPVEYQSDHDPARVKWLVSNYRAREVGTIVVSRRPDGSLVIVDGQHRVLALRELGIEVVRAEIHDGLSIVEEANLFEDLNANRRRPTVFDLFRSRVAGERPDALQVAAIAAEYGYTFRRGGALSRSANHIQAVGAVEAIFRQGGPQLLRGVLSITSGPWAGHSEGLEGQMLRGVAMFLRTDMGNPVDLPRLFHVLGRRPPIAILADARAIAIATGRAGATNGYMPYVLAIQKVYNTDLGSTSRLRLGAPRLNERALPARGRVGKTR